MIGRGIKGMREKRVEFKAEGQKLVGTLCFPEGKGPFPGVVFYHGMVSDRKGYIPLCRKLAKIGIVGLCFDHRGCGESEGEFGQISLVDRLEDAKKALEILRREIKLDKTRLGILGSSAGGYLAALLAEGENIKSLVLRAPPIYDDEIFREPMGKVYESRFTGRGEYKKSRVINRISQYKGSLLIIQSENDEVIPKEVIQAYSNNAVSAREKKIHIIRGATHTLPRGSSYKKEFRRVALDWFRRTLG